LSTECGLVRGNLQWIRVLDLVSESKISWFNFLLDLKEHSIQCDKQRTVHMFKPFVELKNG
ncbi:MAG: hypothetical protein AB1Z29_21685, partial [Desulfobacterales bacterium]